MRRSVIARFVSCCAAVVLAAASIPVWADPPTRVVRLSYAEGPASFSPAADPDNWLEARVNRPLFIGDRLWTDANARTELELGTAVVRAAGPASVTILNLDDRVTQLEISEGRVNVRVRTLGDGETFELDTPNLAFVITAPGQYRVDVDPSGESTVIAVRDGRGQAYGDDRSYVISRSQAYRFRGTNLDSDLARVPVLDPFDRWTVARDQRHDRAVSARYVARTTIGYEDLDEYGSWSVVPEYGNVWTPREVSADWVPYRDGHWAWIDPWGWTWVDDAPWGFAPSHYGRWARVQERWCWVPGPVNARPVYAPALVAFVGGNDFTISAAAGPARAVAWFPLAPGEVYRPAYRVSANYFTQVNVTNTRVSNNVVVNVYNNPASARQVRYRYHEMPAAVTAVALNAFVESRPVRRAALPSQQIARAISNAPVLPAPGVAPAQAGVVAANAPAARRPPPGVMQRQAMAKSPPPAAVPAFAPHELNVNPGSVVDASPHNANQLRPRDRVRVIAASNPSANDRRGPGAPAPGAAPAAAPPAAAAPPTADAAPHAPSAAPPAAAQAHGRNRQGSVAAPAPSAPPSAANARPAGEAATGNDNRGQQNARGQRNPDSGQQNADRGQQNARGQQDADRGQHRGNNDRRGPAVATPTAPPAPPVASAAPAAAAPAAPVTAATPPARRGNGRTRPETATAPPQAARPELAPAPRPAAAQPEHSNGRKPPQAPAATPRAAPAARPSVVPEPPAVAPAAPAAGVPAAAPRGHRGPPEAAQPARPAPAAPPADAHGQQHGRGAERAPGGQEGEGKGRGKGHAPD